MTTTHQVAIVAFFALVMFCALLWSCFDEP